MQVAGLYPDVHVYVWKEVGNEDIHKRYVCEREVHYKNSEAVVAEQ